MDQTTLALVYCGPFDWVDSAHPLLILGNKSFGISSSLRHVCAACVPAKIPFFHMIGKKSLEPVFRSGHFFGGIIAAQWLADPEPIRVHQALVSELAGWRH